jgi:hypothetical protein
LRPGPFERLVRLAQAARRVREASGKPLGSQVREILALRRGPGRLGASQYYAYRLFDEARYCAKERASFVAWDWDEVGGRLNLPAAGLICDDKLVTDALLRGFRLPTPEVVALFHPRGRSHGHVPSFSRLADLAAFLRTTTSYPLFGKPVRDRRGGGASSLDGWDPRSDRLTLAGGESIAVDDYVRQVPGRWYAGAVDRDEAHPGGYLFQRRIATHPHLAAMSGGRAATLRLVILLHPDGPRLFRSALKVAVGANLGCHGVPGTGNLNCVLDNLTGQVTHAVVMVGPQGPKDWPFDMLASTASAHPDTGVQVLGLEVPDWGATVDLCLRAATMFPAVRFQSWDVMPSAEGPLLLELNRRGGLQQLPGGPGFSDGGFDAFLAAWKAIET